MPLGIVSDEDFDSELVDGSVDILAEIIQKKSPGRREADIETPNVLRKIIGDTDIRDGRSEALDLGKALGLSSSSVDSYSNGKTGSSMISKEPDLSGFLSKTKKDLAERASLKAQSAIDSITPDKLDRANAKALSGIARDLCTIVTIMEEKKEIDSSNKVFVFMAPQIKNEKSYEVIDVGD